MDIYLKTRGSKGMDSDGRRGGKDLREIGEGDNIIRIYCKRILFLKKENNT